MLTFADLRDSQAADLRRCVLLIMWWNFVGRTDDEIRKAREDWMASDRFGEVKGYDYSNGDPARLTLWRAERLRSAAPGSGTPPAAPTRR